MTDEKPPCQPLTPPALAALREIPLEELAKQFPAFAGLYLTHGVDLLAGQPTPRPTREILDGECVLLRPKFRK